ncbi:MAG: HEAT repeat domain-containing protein, partial [Pirellulaceae bacterium]
RIWRVTAKGHSLVEPPKIAGASIEELLDVLKRPAYRHRYDAKLALRGLDPATVKAALDRWMGTLSAMDPRYRHHQIEGLWLYRSLDAIPPELVRELLTCEVAEARAAAIQQLRYGHSQFPDAIELLRTGIHDPDSLVRMEAAIAASYIGSKAALEALLEVFQHSMGEHLSYAVTCALGSHTLRPHWERDASLGVRQRLAQLAKSSEIKE